MNDMRFYTTYEVADILKIARSTVVKLILSQKMSATIVGRQYRISEQQLQDYYDANTIQRKGKEQ